MPLWSTNLMAPRGSWRGRGRRQAKQAKQPESKLPHVLFFNWRDSGHPEGGGSEIYVETLATALAELGHQVTIFCAAHGDAPQCEERNGVRFVRRGGRFSVYGHAVFAYITGRLGRADVVVDVQNGVPFWTPVFTRVPVIALVHHVHREQWGVVFPPRVARIGWFLESQVAPRIYRRSSYVAVSQVTKTELTSLGVARDRITVIHNGVAHPAQPGNDDAPHPLVTVLGRLVPHKRIELAVDAVGALREQMPDIRLMIVGQGYWEPWLREHIARVGAQDFVDLVGFVDEQTKHEMLARSWVVAMPSIKEGWGLTVMEGAVHSKPAVAFRAAGGLAESIVDGVTGVLADDQDGFTAALGELLNDQELRRRMGAAAARRAQQFTWTATAEAFATVITLASSGAHVPAVELA